ncbi:hypothetical protein JQS43_08150 [Natronosporangium hydrolyticum]|uniref:RCC1-like domain-containing protein n=1 Tax=Natronosporangium hydrolyticum TaxID=2811111 RepID=A0A895YJP4_9ACTN|nr:hypothetical protein JQS43_08150 [Natronosporangium hydrolyticum]
MLAWGQNLDGQLGIGLPNDRDIPVPSSLPAGVTTTQVAAGSSHSLALTDTGQVLAWGNNFAGQLGTGNFSPSTVPVYVMLPEDTVVTSIAAGSFHSLAVTDTGQVLAWGFNGQGQLGNGTNVPRSNLPVDVLLDPGVVVTGIAAGDSHSLAVTATGEALAWGANGFGQLGDGTNDPSNVPVDVLLPPGVVVTGLAGGFAHSLAVTATGEALAWASTKPGNSATRPTRTAIPPSWWIPIRASSSPRWRPVRHTAWR